MAQSSKELAFAALLLERQLKSYQKLHGEEVEALWKALDELKTHILTMAPPERDTEEESARQPATPYGDNPS